MLVYPQSELIQSTGHIFGDLFNRHALNNRKINSVILPKYIERQALCSAFYMTYSSLFNAVGGFDEFYYNAWEGMEFSLKVKAYNKKLLCNTVAIAYHSTGGSRKMLLLDERQQSAYFWCKNGADTYEDLSYCYKTQLHATANSYICLNFSSIRGYRTYLEKADISITDYYDFHEKHVGQINLLNDIPYSLLLCKLPLLFYVENISQIKGNLLWFKKRNSDSDLVLDTNGNVVFARDLSINAL